MTIDQPPEEAQSDVTTRRAAEPEPDFLAGEKAQQRAAVGSGANWFFWIAGLSLVNTVIVLLEGNWSFITGLGITQLIDGLAIQLSGDIGTSATVVALVLDVAVAGFFVVFGLQARKEQTWAFIAGMVIYALDGLLFVWVKDILSIAFHLFALYCIFQGLRANNRLKALELETATTGTDTYKSTF